MKYTIIEIFFLIGTFIIYLIWRRMFSDFTRLRPPYLPAAAMAFLSSLSILEGWWFFNPGMLFALVYALAQYFPESIFSLPTRSRGEASSHAIPELRFQASSRHLPGHVGHYSPVARPPRPRPSCTRRPGTPGTHARWQRRPTSNQAEDA